MLLHYSHKRTTAVDVYTGSAQEWAQQLSGIDERQMGQGTIPFTAEL